MLGHDWLSDRPLSSEPFVSTRSFLINEIVSGRGYPQVKDIRLPATGSLKFATAKRFTLAKEWATASYELAFGEHLRELCAPDWS